MPSKTLKIYRQIFRLELALKKKRIEPVDHICAVKAGGKNRPLPCLKGAVEPRPGVEEDKVI